MSLSLKINIVDHNVTKTIVFDPTTTVHDACRIIREKCTEADGQGKYQIFSYKFFLISLVNSIEIEKVRYRQKFCFVYKDVQEDDAYPQLN